MWYQAALNANDLNEKKMGTVQTYHSKHIIPERS